jgi:hypothetical protein
MSQQLISRSPDLKRLRDEGYAVETIGGHLLLNDVPYVDGDRQVQHGTLVSTMTLAGEVTTTPDTHVAMFAGSMPCDAEGNPLNKIVNGSGRQELAPGVVIDHTFSSKPVGRNGYEDYYEKMATYAEILSGPARALDPAATPRSFRPIEDRDEKSPFRYTDTASSRAGIDLISQKLELDRVAIVGLGGTGSYILDLVAKTPVGEIHIYDGDRLEQHNAFRAPGAPSLDELRSLPQKVAYYSELYSRMRRGVVAHDCYIDDGNVGDLEAMSFVFLAMDRGAAKASIIEVLERSAVPFVDVGMGIYEVEGALAGSLRVTTSTPEQRDHALARIPLGDSAEANEYARNIQIADLNALNASLAVVRWKRLLGFYNDLEHEHHSIYEVDGNHLLNEDHP